jgi:hypothetical protein
MRITKRSKDVYVIMCHWNEIDAVIEEKVRDIIDPNRSKSGRHGLSWRFKKKAIADKYYFQLVLTFS